MRFVAEESLDSWQTLAIEYPVCDELIVETFRIDESRHSILYLQNVEVIEYFCAFPYNVEMVTSTFLNLLVLKAHSGFTCDEVLADEELKYKIYKHVFPRSARGLIWYPLWERWTRPTTAATTTTNMTTSFGMLTNSVTSRSTSGPQLQDSATNFNRDLYTTLSDSGKNLTFLSM